MKKFVVFIICLMTCTFVYAEEVNISDEKTINKTELSSNNRLEDITIDGISVNGFSPDINYYSNIIVKKPVVFVDIKGQDDKATVTGVGMVFCREGVETKIDVNVTSEDGHINIYTLSVTYVKEIIKSVDASIDKIELYNKDTKLDFTFDKDKSSFKIQVDSNIEKVLVKASLSNDKASFIDGYEPGEFKLNYGDNIIELRSMSENGDTRIYKINVIRSDNRKSDNTLKELIINDNKIELIKDKYNYEVNVSFDTRKTIINAKTTDKNAKVVFKNIDLYEGNNSLVIRVVAENEKTKEYRINIKREEKVKDLPIESIQVEDVKENADAIVPTVKEKEENKIIENNYIDENKTDNNDYIKYVVLGVGIVLLTISVIFFIRNKK